GGGVGLRRIAINCPQGEAVGRDREVVAERVENDLPYLSVGQVGPELLPLEGALAEVAGRVNAGVRADVDDVGVRPRIDQDRPHGQVGQISADVLPVLTAGDRLEDATCEVC